MNNSAEVGPDQEPKSADAYNSADDTHTEGDPVHTPDPCPVCDADPCRCNNVGGGTRLIKSKAQGNRKAQAESKAENASETTITCGRLRAIRFDGIKPDLARPQLVEDYLDHGRLTANYGQPKEGKSFIELDMGLHIALGWQWMARRVEQGAVVYIAAEGAESIERRAEAFRRHHSLEGEAIPFWVVPCPIDLRDPDADVRDLVKLIEAIAKDAGQPVVLVVVDTVARAMAGGDEGSNQDMSAMVSNCDKVRLGCGAHVRLVHHEGKDKSRGLRGASALLGGVDGVTKTRKYKGGRFSSIDQEQRDREESAVIWFKLHQLVIGHDRNDKPIKSCVVLPADAAPQNDRLTPQARKARDILRELGAEATEDRWREACQGQLSKQGAGEDAERMAFNRARNLLVREQIVEADEETGVCTLVA